MDTKYRAAIVGLGKIAWKMGINSGVGDSLSHAAAYQANPETMLVAGCSPDDSDNHAFHHEFDLPVYDSLDRMLEEQKPDIVSVCSPTAIHFEQMLGLLEKEVSMVWLEKPPCESVSQLNELIALRDKKSKTTIVVNYQRRYSSSYQRLHDLIRDNVYGPVRIVEVRYSKGLLVNGSHMLDQLFYLLGEREWGLEWVEKSSKDGNPSFTLRLGNDIRVMVSATHLPYHNLDIVVTFDKARFSILHGGMTTRQEVACEHELFPGFYRLCDTDECLLGKGGFDYSYDNALKDLVQAYRKGIPPVSNLDTAVYAQRLLEQVLQPEPQ